MLRVPIRTSAPVLAFLVGVILPGCRRDEVPGVAAPVAFNRKIPVHVSNENWLTVHVYAMSDAHSRSLGVVSTGRDEIFEVPADLAHRSDLRFRAEPIGSNDRYVSEPIFIGSAEAVYFTIANALHLSSVVLR